MRQHYLATIAYLRGVPPPHYLATIAYLRCAPPPFISPPSPTCGVPPPHCLAAIAYLRGVPFPDLFFYSSSKGKMIILCLDQPKPNYTQLNSTQLRRRGEPAGLRQPGAPALLRPAERSALVSPRPRRVVRVLEFSFCSFLGFLLFVALGAAESCGARFAVLPIEACDWFSSNPLLAARGCGCFFSNPYVRRTRVKTHTRWKRVQKKNLSLHLNTMLRNRKGVSRRPCRTASAYPSSHVICTRASMPHGFELECAGVVGGQVTLCNGSLVLRLEESDDGAAKEPLNCQKETSKSPI